MINIGDVVDFIENNARFRGIVTGFVDDNAAIAVIGYGYLHFQPKRRLALHRKFGEWTDVLRNDTTETKQ